jgi:hypothetical protein
MLKETPEATIRRRNADRLQGHERVIADPELMASAIRFAGLVMHRFNPHRGFAQVSHRYAAKTLKTSERTALRARDQLEFRGWLYHINKERSTGLPNVSARYALGAGPEDIRVEAEPHEEADASDSRC